MARCKVCGKQIPRGNVMCNDCTEATRMKIPLPPNVGSAVKPAPASEVKITMDEVQGDVMAHLMSDKDPYGEVPTQRKIREITDAMKDLLLYKNQKYGDSAINPIEIFTKHLKNVDTKTAAILVRIDDKLSRVKNGDELRKNDICDLIGYLTLLNVAIGTTAEDIAKFKD